MATTPLMNLQIPGPRQVPFIDTIDEFFGAVDAWLQSLREDSLSLSAPGFDGSPWVVDTMEDTVSWGTDIIIGSGDGGGRAQIPAGSLPLPNMHILCAVLPSRPITGVVTPSLVALPTVPRDPNTIALGVRAGPLFIPLRPAHQEVSNQIGHFFQAAEQIREEFDAGDFVSGSWVTRPLNYAQMDRGAPMIVEGPFPSLVLADGAYRIIGSAPAFRVGKHMTRIVDVGSGTALLQGTTEFAAFEDSEAHEMAIQTRSHVNGYVQGPATIALQHQCQVTQLGNGLGIGNAGVGGAFGCEESFAVLQVEYLGEDRKPEPEPLPK